MTVAVVGGAGYIGGHVRRTLQERGERVVVIDDLSTGIERRVADVAMLRQDIAAPGAPAAVARFLRDSGVTAVMHFAAKKQVGESVTKPLWYYRQNVGGTANILQACVDSGVADVVFSSSAAVYGSPQSATVDEAGDPAPINPYGETKLAGEWLVADVSKAHGIRSTSLRYFNVVGASESSLADTGQFNLVPIALARTAAGEHIDVFGSDYPTTDGTCVRDYVHVQDLVDAHLAALDASRRQQAGAAAIYNVGTGRGTSVREVLDVVRSVTGCEVESRNVDRRRGDPAALSADVSRIANELEWRAVRTIEEGVRSAWEAMRPSC